jgi:hypothetical protein
LWLELWFFIFGYWRFTLHCSWKYGNIRLELKNLSAITSLSIAVQPTGV